jgi:hypothetical protein
MKRWSVCFVLFFVFLLVSHASEAYDLLDGKLRVKGRLEQYNVFLTNAPSDDNFYRKHKLAVNQSIFTVEGLYTLVDNGSWLINFQNYYRYYYDSAPDLDSHLRRSFSTKRRMHDKYMTNRYDSDDWINEMYVDIYKGPWNIRLGKQVVAWSEVEMVQTIDKINPIDLRYATPGIQPFDEIKLGLWMFRGFYNSDLPGRLIFEHIFIPGDFERTRTPFEGCWASRRPAPGEIRNAPGQGDAVYWMMDQASPRLSLSNYQYAFRIRGNSEFFLFKTPYVVDWTVSYWNGLDTGHAVFEDTETVNNALNTNAVTRVGNQPGPPLPYGRDVAAWKRYEAVGGSFQTFVPLLQAVLRGELSYEIGRKWNSIDPSQGVDRDTVGSLGNFAEGTIERDYFSYGITIDKPLRIPFYGDRMTKWGVRPYWDATFGVFGGYWVGNVHRVWQWSNSYGYKSNTFLTFMLRGGFRHNEFIPVLRAQYNPKNFGYVAPGISYMPGKHFRFELGSIWFYAKNPAVHREAAVEDRDMVYTRIRYEYQ